LVDTKLFRNQREEREDATFTVMLGPHHEDDVFDGHHHDERPDHQGKDAEDVGTGSVEASGRVQALLERIERAGTDVAEDDAQRA
jgi:hypothetical protein